MSKIQKALLAGAIAAALLAAGCSGEGADAGAGQEAPAVEAFAKGKPLQASFADSRLSGMKGVAENGRLRLLANDETGEIAVLDQASGEIWRSNPAEADADPLASGINKELLSSQLQLDFYNSFGQISSINSFTDSVKHKQLRMEKIGGGVSVTYQFGTAQKTAEDVPLRLSAKRMEELSAKLDNTGKRALKIAYTENKETAVFERNDDALNGLQLTRALQALETAGYTPELLEQDMAELGFTQEKAAPRVFQATVNYTLEEGSLLVHVPVGEIRFPAAYPVNTISVLSFFGAGSAREQGSIFVPDGSGSLIHFNNGKAKYPAYQQMVYGSDQTMERIEDDAREQPVRLPVFGLIKEKGAFLGIIEEGAAAAAVKADVSGRLNSYNNVYPSFYVINKGEVTLDANGQQRSLPKFQEAPMKSDFKVRYVFLNGEDASYEGMARYYRSYLLDGGALAKPAEAKAEDMPFYLQLVGSISKKKHLLGIPYEAQVPLTTFKQAEDIVEKLQERSISSIRLKYDGWFNGGLDHEVPSSVSVDRAVGGAKGLESFAAFAEAKGIELYPAAALLVAQTAKGFDESEDAARTLRAVPARVYPLDLALNRRDRTQEPSYVVSPRFAPSYAGTLADSLKDSGAGGVALTDLASQLNSDYRKRDQIDRTESERYSLDALQQFRERGLSMMGEGGNVYALPYLTDVTHAPMGDSSFKLEDEEIPFYQMVVRGSVRYAGRPFNLSSYTDDRLYVLRCIEYGAGVSFEWIYAPNSSVKDSDYHRLYAVNYGMWLDKAAAMYKEVNEALGPAGQSPIVGHEKLAEGVYRTEYGSGLAVIVNYNAHPVQAEGRTIEARSYATGGGQA